MPSSNRWLRHFARVEVRLAATVAVWTALLIAVVLAAFVMMASHEALEELSVGLRRYLRGIGETEPGSREAELRRLSAMLDVQGISLRVIESGGVVRSAGRPWPAEKDCYRGGLGAFTPMQVRRSDFLVRSHADDAGATLEAAVALQHFVHEREEMNAILAATLLAGCVLASAVAAALARRSLRPLRMATEAVESISEDRLEARLPERGTNDLVDRHARAVNQVLARLQWSFARIRAFSADTAHELRTPVNRILNLAEVVALENATDSERAEALTRLQDSASGMSRLIDSLLLLASGEEGRLRLRQVRLDLAQLVVRLVDLFRPACEERAIDLIVELESTSVDADEQLLSQCLSNLLDNALRYSPEGKPLRISVERLGHAGVVRVEDSGPGIPPEERERVFDRFVQLDPARSSGRAGLGLAIARMIAKLHHGSLSIQESGLGGASFELTLPR
jgi:signal transduction histidine kinase